MDDVLTVPQGEFTLHRDHHEAGPLRAWDAADEYVLAHLAEAGVSGDRWLVVNDGFGALATVLADHRPQSWSDSHVAIEAARANLVRNDLDPDLVRFVPSTDVPEGPIDVVIVKVPRTIAFLDDELRRLRPLLHEGSVVIGAGMTKSVHNSTIEVFERSIGPTPTTRARKKARLLLAQVNPRLEAPAPLEPITWKTHEGVAVTNLPTVFSSGSPDAGARLLLTHLPEVPPGARVIDLGCGNGIIGATLARRNPDIELRCIDESYQAVASARVTVGSEAPTAAFAVADSLVGIPDDDADLIVVNPPFHAGGARTHDVAGRMFADARRVLRPGGQLIVVGNRHLGHHKPLRNLFDSVTALSSDPSFVVLSAR